MNRKTAALCLASDAALFVTLTATGVGRPWALIAIGVLAVPVLIAALLPQSRDSGVE